MAVLTSGCARRPPQVAPAPPVTIPVSKPIDREVTDFVDFTGRTDAVQSVDIRPRVTGYLVKMPFKEGAEVKEGDLLFEIDPRPYQAQLDQAQGQVNLYQAQLKLARTTYCAGHRRSTAGPPTPSASSSSTRTRRRSRRPRPGSRPTRRTCEVYKLNLEFTKVVSPIDGQVSRYYLTLGNLVNQDQTLLTTVVSLDPMYAYFDMDEPTLLRIRKAINEGKIKPQRSGGRRSRSSWACRARTASRTQGTINFVNNQVNPDDGQHLGARRLPQPQAAGGRPAALARHVRADPPADRPAAPGAAGHRPGRSARTRG